MEDQIEFFVFKGEAFGHVSADDADIVPFPFRHHAVIFQLLFRVIHHGAVRPERGKNRHLLTAAGGQSQDLFPFDFAKPFMRNFLCRGQMHVPNALFCLFIRLMADGLSPFPAALHPAVDRFRVDILIIHTGNSSITEIIS